MFRLLFFAAVGVFVMVIGFKKIGTNSTPVVCPLNVLEKGDYSEYDYFKLSKAVPYGAYIYSRNIGSKSISEFVFPVFSRDFLDSIIRSGLPLDTIDSWVENGKIRPKVYIKSKYTNISLDQMKQFMNDNSEKAYEGTRLVSFADLNDKIKGELDAMGITPDNTIFIEEGATPGNNKLYGWIALIVGGLITFYCVRGIVRRVRDA